MLKYEPETYITEKHMKIGKQDLEKKLMEIRCRIDFYEAKRKELSGMFRREEEKWESTNKRLQELWAEFRELYSLLRDKH